MRVGIKTRQTVLIPEDKDDPIQWAERYLSDLFLELEEEDKIVDYGIIGPVYDYSSDTLLECKNCAYVYPQNELDTRFVKNERGDLLVPICPHCGGQKFDKVLYD